MGRHHHPKPCPKGKEPGRPIKRQFHGADSPTRKSEPHLALLLDGYEFFSKRWERLRTDDMPLHPKSLSAATFTEAAGEQGRYWQAQEILFQKEPEWGTKHGQPGGAQADINTLFRKYAAELGLDMGQMDGAFAENRFAAKLERDKKDGEALGVQRTPTLFVNGRQLVRLNERDLKALIEDELAR